MATRKNKRNSYPLNQCPLFKLKSKKKLADILGMSVQEIESLVKREDNYRVFFINKANGKPRKIEEPKPHLERIHRRLFNLLSRIKAPEYLHSGVVNRSYISNAAAHLNADTALTLDIEGFFPSTLGWHVFEFFELVMQCSRDVSGLITRLSTVAGTCQLEAALVRSWRFMRTKICLMKLMHWLKQAASR